MSRLIPAKRNSGVVSKKLPESVRSSYESRYGYASSGLHVVESDLPNELGVEALTQGSTIHFTHGGYMPGSAHGRTVLDHELGHTVQQARGEVRADESGINNSPALESAASHSVAPSSPMNSGRSSLSPLPSASTTAPVQCFNNLLTTKGKLNHAKKKKEEFMAEQEAAQEEKEERHRQEEMIGDQSYGNETSGSWLTRHKAKKRNKEITEARKKLAHRAAKQLFKGSVAGSAGMQRLWGNAAAYDEKTGKHLTEPGDTPMSGASNNKHEKNTEYAGLGMDVVGGLAYGVPSYIKSANKLFQSDGMGGKILNAVAPDSSDDASTFFGGLNNSVNGIGGTPIASSLQGMGGIVHGVGGILEAATAQCAQLSVHQKFTN